VIIPKHMQQWFEWAHAVFRAVSFFKIFFYTKFIRRKTNRTQNVPLGGDIFPVAYDYTGYQESVYLETVKIIYKRNSFYYIISLRWTVINIVLKVCLKLLFFMCILGFFTVATCRNNEAHDNELSGVFHGSFTTLYYVRVPPFSVTPSWSQSTMKGRPRAASLSKTLFLIVHGLWPASWPTQHEWLFV